MEKEKNLNRFRLLIEKTKDGYRREFTLQTESNALIIFIAILTIIILGISYYLITFSP